MKQNSLSDTKIKSAKPKDKEYNLGDGRGLSLRVRIDNNKFWIFNYTHALTQKRKNLSLGSYPALSLKSARIKADEYRSMLAQNIDPKEQRDTEHAIASMKELDTFECVTNKWLELKAGSIVPKTLESIKGSLDNHVLPVIGKTPISKLTAQQAIQCLTPVAEKGSLETVKRLCQRLNEIMIYATNTGLIEHNPLAGITKAFQAPKKQHLPTLTPDQLPRLLRAIQFAQIKLVTRFLIEWQLHTMVRPNEAAQTRWDEIDFHQKLWVIPAHRMKKKERDHIVPLSPQALRLLKNIKQITGHREYVFPADRNPRQHANPQTANAALKRMGFKSELVAHGLRALASTTLNEADFDPDVIESALAHVDKNEVRKAYNRAQYLKQRREMMSWWSNHIEKASQGSLSLAVNQ